MNTDKIKELWRQVDTIQYDRVYGNLYRPYIPLQIDGQPTRFEITDIHLEKFAELLIRECADQCTTEGPFVAEIVWGKQFHKKILEHFGVEE
jgi:hypothetical protein